MLPRMLAPAVFRVGEPDRGGCGLSSRPIIEDIGPEAASLRLAVARRKHRNRCVVGMDLRCAQHMLADLIDQWSDQLAGCTYASVARLANAFSKSGKTLLHVLNRGAHARRFSSSRTRLRGAIGRIPCAHRNKIQIEDIKICLHPECALHGPLDRRRSVVVLKTSLGGPSSEDKKQGSLSLRPLCTERRCA